MTNDTKSQLVVLTLNKRSCPDVSLNNGTISLTRSVKYINVHLD